MNKSMYWAGGTITQIEICRVILRYNNLAVHPLWDMLNLNEFKKKKNLTLCSVIMSLVGALLWDSSVGIK